jgi:tRNA pseudouridine55 synthase
VRPRGLDPAGLVLVDKPAGPSSFAIVRDLRDRTGARAGHAGTLDPFATGLLLVLLGRFTKEQNRFMRLGKRYLAEVDLTRTTTTGDLEGEAVEEHAAPARERLEELLAPLRGEVELRIPAASAVKVGGERAYRLHRRGIEVNMPVRRSTVHSLELLSYDGEVATLDLLVGSGTYVRSIAGELGGHCRSLRRTEIGPFRVEDADPARIVPPEEALAAL